MLGEIAFDENVMSYNYSDIQDKTKESMKSILLKCKEMKKRGSLSTVKQFQEMKSGK